MEIPMALEVARETRMEVYVEPQTEISYMIKANFHDRCVIRGIIDIVKTICKAKSAFFRCTSQGIYIHEMNNNVDLKCLFRLPAESMLMYHFHLPEGAYECSVAFSPDEVFRIIGPTKKGADMQLNINLNPDLTTHSIFIGPCGRDAGLSVVNLPQTGTLCPYHEFEIDTWYRNRGQKPISKISLGEFCEAIARFDKMTAAYVKIERDNEGLVNIYGLPTKNSPGSSNQPFITAYNFDKVITEEPFYVCIKLGKHNDIISKMKKIASSSALSIYAMNMENGVVCITAAMGDCGECVFTFPTA
jgi:hypothetical protein